MGFMAGIPNVLVVEVNDEQEREEVRRPKREMVEVGANKSSYLERSDAVRRGSGVK